MGVAACVLAACGGRYQGPAAPAPPANTPGDGDGPRGVAAAALPYGIVDARTGAMVDEADFWAALRRARAVCVGEDHPNPHHHWAQLTVVDHLAEGEISATPRALGLEMLQVPFQGVVHDYEGKLIDQATFLSRVGWSDRWGYDYALYQPMIDRALGAGWRLLALNAARELTKRVSKVGVAGLDADEKAQLPQLDLANPRHKAWFDGVMEAMGGDHHGAGTDGAPPPGMPSPENMYAAQVVWDESMAEHAHAWLDRTPGGKIVILAGNGHCHDSAVVGRIQRRGVAEVISVQPIVDDGEGNVASALLEKRNDYLFIMTMPRPAAAAK